MNTLAYSIDRERQPPPRAALRTLIVIAASLALLQVRSPVLGAQGSLTFEIVSSFGAPSGPNAPLVEGTPGTFLGTTKFSGGLQLGDMFRLNPDRTVEFFGPLDDAGKSEPSGLLKAADGRFYFTDTWGGSGHEGAIYRFDTSAQLTKLAEFSTNSPSFEPNSTLIQAADQQFYGTSAACVSAINALCFGGTVFKMNASGSVTPIHRFLGTSHGEGAEPHSVIQGSDGSFYGTTRLGGTHDAGTVYKMDTSGTVTIRHSFDPSVESAFPVSPLVQGADGLLYGTTMNNGSSTTGSIFRIGRDGSNYSVLHVFNLATEGQPRSGLIEAKPGHFYGATDEGSATHGMVYDLDASTGQVTILHAFASDGSEGQGAKSALFRGSDANFYGIAQNGGPSLGGVVYRLVDHSSPMPQLTVTKTGTGDGTVSSNPAGINCGATCSVPVSSGTLVTLTATPDPTSAFVGWSGEGCSDTGTCVVTMDSGKNVTATFKRVTAPVSVSIAGAGVGTVTSPGGITCGTAIQPCAANIALNTTVTLTATPDATSTFAGWNGGGCSGTGLCTLTVTAATSVTATFAKLTYRLSVSFQGNGSGSVLINPGGINCVASCGSSFAPGTIVTLTATANMTTSTFAGWSGAGCSGTGPCVVTMDAAKSVTATFNKITYPLNVSFPGTGGGTVTIFPGPITCTASCTANFVTGASVTLQAAPNSSSLFTAWSGAPTCTGGTCSLTMNGAQTVAATFTATTASVSLIGTGAGTVSSTPQGINCPTTCSATFQKGTGVTLTATPADGTSIFAGWTGACSGTGSTCSLTMNAAKSVTATFTRITASVTLSGSGFGNVKSNPAGINCPTTCSANFTKGTVVTLTATPTDGTSIFAGWTGACINLTGTCTVTMSGPQNVTATFTRITASVTLAGSGSGNVMSTPTAINCPTTCSANFTKGTVVTLTATPAAGSIFVGWSGACSGTSTCALTMNAAKSVTAKFTKVFVVSVTKSGAGTVSSNPAGINCGTACSASLASGTTVTLTATPSKGWFFAGWSGACSGKLACVLTMDAAKSVTATFTSTPIPEPLAEPFVTFATGRRTAR